MKLSWIAIAVAALVAGSGIVAADTAQARTKHRVKARCVDRPYVFTWGGIFTNPAPQPNGCSPAVYEYGKYVGQDPDPFIRQELRRDPRTGYSPF
jgi:hypothetical protein